MKKLISIILCVLLLSSMMTACSPNSNNSKISKVDKYITTYPSEGKVTKLVPDPNAKGELNISNVGYHNESQENDYYNIAIKMYKELYPNVKVNLEVSSGDYEEYAKKLNTQIMAGKGPDLFWMIGDVVDPYKIMESGALADLSSYFKNDPNFNIDDFNKAVFYGGQMKGKQYIVPLSYLMPFFLTTKSIVDETGFNMSKCTDYFSCGKEIARVAGENKFECQEKQMIAQFRLPYLCPEYMGIDWINYEKNTANIDTPQMKKAYEMLKTDFFHLFTSNNGGGTEHKLYAEDFKEKQIIFSEMRGNSFAHLVQNVQTMITKEEEPVIFPWRNVNQKIQTQAPDSVSVLKNSKNIQNAYNFIKILISPEFVLKYDDTNLGGVPISNVVAKKFLESKMVPSKLFTQNGLTTLSALPQKFIDEYMGYLSEADGVSFIPMGLYYVREIMQPYLEGKRSYEECIKSAQEKLEIYITE